MNETDYSFATQKLSQSGNSIYIADKRILDYKKGRTFSTKALKTKILKGEIFINEDQQVINLTNEEDLSRLGFCVMSEKIAGGESIYFRGQMKKYFIVRTSPSAQAVRFPPGHYVQYDVTNKIIRLVGRSAGLSGFGPWVPIKKTSKNPDKHGADIMNDYLGEGEAKVELETVDVPEIPIMISEEGELVCLPMEKDEPTIGIVGVKRTGKSFCLHGVADRVYWKWRKNIAILNDLLNECGSWALPWVFLSSRNTAAEPSFAKQLKMFGEQTQPLPVVFLTPITSTLTEITLPNSGVSFKISFPFKELIMNYNFYLRERKEWNMINAGRYFRAMLPDLIKCKKIDDVEKVVYEHMPGKQDAGMKNKIISVMQDIFDRGFLDVNTGVTPKWRVKMSDGHQGFYSPAVACMLAGLVPVLQTRDISNKDFFPQYFRYVVGDIFRKQFNDEYFRKKQLQSWVFIDEITGISSTSKPGPASEILEKCVAEGGPARLGFVYATQNYSKVPHRIRSNTKYLFAFRFNSSKEVNAIASDFSLTRAQKEKILKLDKFEMLAITSEHFVCYDSDGNKRISELNEVFKGRSLPPLSMHKSPKLKDELEGESMEAAEVA